MIIILLGIFVFSFSRLVDNSNTFRYTHATNLINNSDLSSFTVKLDSLHTSYVINDCPSLRNVTIKGNNGFVSIYNCPSLTEINYSKNFAGSITVFNCPYVLENEEINNGGYTDSIYYNSYRSQNPIKGKLTGDNKYWFDYDSIHSTIRVLHFPVYSDGNTKGKVLTNLPDSIKKRTVCYVPYGYRNKFLYLEEYKPFKSIEEMPIFYTWETNAIGMFGFLKTEKLWLILTIIGVIFVQILFWITAFNKYKYSHKNTVIIFSYSLSYGIGMSLLAILSFMSIYWLFYNIILPTNQLIATAFGVVACILCLGIVYKNTFYSFTRYLKRNGINGVVYDLKRELLTLPNHIKASVTQAPTILNNIRNVIHANTYIGVILLIMFSVSCIGFYAYIHEKEKRSFYLRQLNEMLDSGQYARVYAIVQGILQQHNNLLYPSFADSLKSIKKILDGDSIYLAHQITPSYLRTLASKEDIPLDFSRFEKIITISEDGNSLVLCLKYDKSNDFQQDMTQAVYLNVKENYFKVITPKSKSRYDYDFRASFSPNGNSLVVTDDSKIYLYTNSTKSVKPISEGHSTRDLLLENDSIYYYTDWGRLYKANVNTTNDRILVNESEEIYKDLYLISPNLIGATGNWSEVIIYNTKEDSVYFHSKHRGIGDIRSINQNYAITTNGLLDVELDSIVNDNSRLYNY